MSNSELAKTMAMAMSSIGFGLMFGGAVGIAVRHGSTYAFPIIGAALFGLALCFLLRANLP